MSIINLKIIYPDYYSDDFVVEVSEQIAQVLKQSLRDEAAYRRNCRNNGVNCFFDSCNEEYIAARSNAYQTLEQVLDQQLERRQLYRALNLLPPLQARRVYAHHILGMSKTDIAKYERVDESAVRRSIMTAERNLRNILKIS